VRHTHSLGLRTFVRQHLNYGRGAFHLHVARDRRGVAPIRIESNGFYSRLIGHPLGKGGGGRAAALSALLFTSQVAYVCGYLLERARGGVRRRLPRPSASS
jgi:hypothetical protein